MVNLINTPVNSTPEITFSEYEPHFNWVVNTTHTPTYIATKYPELFYHRKLTLELTTLKDTRRALSESLHIAIKDITVINFPKTLISSDVKLYQPVFNITWEAPVIVPSNSNLLDYLNILKKASKIVTEQEIFTYFAYIHHIPCLTFYTNWNANAYKHVKWIILLPAGIRDKAQKIQEFLSH